MKNKLLLLAGIVAALLIFFYFQSPDTGAPEWGLNFSILQAGYLGIPWQNVYLEMLNELKPPALRTMAYWPLLEPEKDKFNFADFDWLLGEAAERNIKVILVVGKKQPRWPECHVPEWANSPELPLSPSLIKEGVGGSSEGKGEFKNQELLEYIEVVIKRYKNNPAIWAWQVENEPFFPFGPDCPSVPVGLYRQELALVKSLDKSRPILVTDSGEKGAWLPTAWAGGDIFGSTMYREVYHHQKRKYIKYPIPPALYRLKAGLVKSFSGINEFIGVELQAEPWFVTDARTTPWPRQQELMNPGIFLKNLDYARKAGFAEHYLWGVEWWYWAKEQGHPEMWEEGKRLFSNQ